MAVVPSWVPGATRTVLALLLIALGVSRFADGYGMTITTIGAGLLVAELVGVGLARPAADELAAEVVALVAEGLKLTGYAGPAAPSLPSAPSASAPVDGPPP